MIGQFFCYDWPTLCFLFLLRTAYKHAKHYQFVLTVSLCKKVVRLQLRVNINFYKKKFKQQDYTVHLTKQSRASRQRF